MKILVSFVNALRLAKPVVEVDYPVVPRIGERVSIEDFSYVVRNVVHNLSSGEVLIVIE